jgi:hypothetical protein
MRSAVGALRITLADIVMSAVIQHAVRITPDTADVRVVADHPSHIKEIFEAGHSGFVEVPMAFVETD